MIFKSGICKIVGIVFTKKRAYKLYNTYTAILFAITKKTVHITSSLLNANIKIYLRTNDKGRMRILSNGQMFPETEALSENVSLEYLLISVFYRMPNKMLCVTLVTNKRLSRTEMII